MKRLKDMTGEEFHTLLDHLRRLERRGSDLYADPNHPDKLNNVSQFKQALLKGRRKKMDIQVGDMVRVLKGSYHFVPAGSVVEVVDVAETKVRVVFTGTCSSGEDVESMWQLLYLEDIEKV